MSGGRTLSHSADGLAVVAVTVVESGTSGVPVVDEAELVVLVVSGATVEVGLSGTEVAAAVVVASGPVVSPDEVVHAASATNTTTNPANHLVFTMHLHASSVPSGVAQEVEDNGPTALLAVLGGLIRAGLSGPLRSHSNPSYTCRRSSRGNTGPQAIVVAGELGLVRPDVTSGA